MAEAAEEADEGVDEQNIEVFSGDTYSETYIPLARLLSLYDAGNASYLRIKNVNGTLPPSFFDDPRVADLRVLNLRDCNVAHVPWHIIRMRGLRYLDITGNHRITLSWKLARMNLQRLLVSPSLLNVEENYMVPYSTQLSTSYCGDSKWRRVSTLADLAAETMSAEFRLTELDEMRTLVPSYLAAYFTPEQCAECGIISHKMVARRVRKAVVSFCTVPLMYTLCSPSCLKRIQKTWQLEEQLNTEKRALRFLKFGEIESQTARYSASPR